MIFLFLSLIILLPTFWGIGELTEKIIGKSSETSSAKIFTGIFAITVFTTIWAFFFPLNLGLEIGLVVLGMFFFFQTKAYQDLLRIFFENKILSVVGTATILFSGTFFPFILDHFGYYVPSILWLKEVGLVKGISNLELILGQMSFWHIFQAAFSHFSDVFLRINSILLCAYFLYILEKKAWIHLLFIPFFLFFTQSPSPDLPVFIFSLVVLQEIFSGNKNTSWLFAVATLAFAIKPTVIWLPIFVFLYSAFIVKSNWKKYSLGLMIGGLFVIKNLWTFGFPIFPMTVLDFGLDWKPNPKILKASNELAIMKTYDMQFSYEQIQQFTSFDYVKNWFFLKGMKSVINILFILSLISLLVFTISKKQKLLSILCISILIKSVLVLQFSAQYRFFLEVFFVVFLVIFNTKIKKKTAIFIATALSFAILFSMTFPQILQTLIPSFRMGGFMGKTSWKQVYKPSEYKINKYDSLKIGNLKFNVTKRYPFNFDTPIPAISEYFVKDNIDFGIFPQLIDSANLKKGFIWKEMSDREKIQGQKTIDFLKQNDSLK